MLPKTLKGAPLVILVALCPAVAACGEPPSTHPPMRPVPQPSDRPVAEGRSHYVDATRGDDDAAGSRRSPWRTLRHAIDQLAPGDTLYLREGVYYERLLIRRLSGREGAPITVRSYPGELAVIDGGLPDLLKDPGRSWEPVPDGAVGEFRTKKVYPEMDGVQGYFADSMVPLQAYRNLADLRADEERWVDHDAPLYCGPGLWFDVWSGRIHARFAHTRLEALPEADRYRGETDPRRLPLVVGGGKRVPLWIEDSAHLRFQDLVVRGAGLTAIRLLESRDVELDGLTVYSGKHALLMTRTDRLRVLRSAFRGTAAPWSFRSSHKYRGIPGILFLTEAFVHKSQDLEIAHSEFTDGHDGVFLGEVDGVRFHHNLVENFNDDGIFLTGRRAGPDDVHIFQNRLKRCLTLFAYGWGRGRTNRPGDGVWIYRNLVEQLRPVHYFPPNREEPQVLDFYGRVASDHGNPIWEPATIYHNTFVVRRGDPRHYALGWGGHLAGTSRRLFNNLLVQVEGMPTSSPPPPTADFQADGNLVWSVEAGPGFEGDFFARLRAVPGAAEAEGAARLEGHGLFADPRFVRFDPDAPAESDFRPRAGSAAIDAGVELPSAWPDPLRGEDAGAPDVGARPAGGAEPALRSN